MNGNLVTANSKGKEIIKTEGKKALIQNLEENHM